MVRGMEHRFPVTVYYEDTDCMQVVYHANYLHFLERARSELIASLGQTVQEWTEQGYMFPVYQINMTFRASGRLSDGLVVVTEPQQTSPYRIMFKQRIERPRDGKVLVDAVVHVVCTDLNASLREFPPMGVPSGPATT